MSAYSHTLQDTFDPFPLPLLLPLAKLQCAHQQMHPSKRALLPEPTQEMVDYVVGRFDPDPEAGVAAPVLDYSNNIFLVFRV